MVRALLLLITIGVGVAACSEREATGSRERISVMDSNGIRLVTLPAAPTRHGVNLATTSTLRIGGAAANGSLLVKPIDVALTSVGDFVVLDAGASQVLVFAPSGALRRKISGPGPGPGEFGRMLTHIFLGPGDTIYVPNAGHKSLEVFSIDGRHTATLQMPFGGGPPVGFGLMRGEAVRAGIKVQADTAGHGMFVPNVTFVAARADSSAALGSVSAGDSPTAGLYAAVPAVAFANDHIIVGSVDGYELRTYNMELQPKQIWRREWLPQPITESDQSALLTKAFEQLPPGIREKTIATMRAQIKFASRYPPMAAVIIASDNSVWVNRPMRGSEAIGPEVAFTFDQTGSRHWEVFDSAGNYSMQVSLPVGFQLKRVAGGQAIGIGVDSAGTPVVEERAIVTSP